MTWFSRKWKEDVDIYLWLMREKNFYMEMNASHNEHDFRVLLLLRVLWYIYNCNQLTEISTILQCAFQEFSRNLQQL